MIKRIIILSLLIIAIIISVIVVYNEKKKIVNVKELIQDIESIRKDNKIINAKEEKDNEPLTYNGKGYKIATYLNDDYSTEYIIYSNGEEIWHFIKK